MVFNTMEQSSFLIILNMENDMLDAVELLDSYEKSATAAILDATDNQIGAGTDPISFIICAFRSQADKIKELTGKRKVRSHHAVSKSEVKRLVSQTTDREDIITYGPTEEDGGCFVYWGGECRGKLMPQFADSRQQPKSAAMVRAENRV